MIILKKLNGCEIVLNADLIETIEQTPDTIITLNNGKKMVVCNTPQEVIKMVVDFKQKTMNKFL
ncbi:MAG: endoflagellar protein [Firmicutes bacterium HGW-Firmicutes-12]|jgi:flagellar protein FlbD|nr:MAG: endoflagellar protein [Firmicutes bacterium HGW-Firmicutes-12]